MLVLQITDLFVLRGRRIPKSSHSSEHRIRTIRQTTHAECTKCLPTLDTESLIVFKLHVAFFILFFCMFRESFNSKIWVHCGLTTDNGAPLRRFSVCCCRRIWLAALSLSPTFCFILSQTHHDVKCSIYYKMFLMHVLQTLAMFSKSSWLLMWAYDSRNKWTAACWTMRDWKAVFPSLHPTRRSHATACNAYQVDSRPCQVS